MSKKNSGNVNVETTDIEIAVRATGPYLPRNAQPALCVRLLQVCYELADLESDFAIVRAIDMMAAPFRELTVEMVDAIVDAADLMERQRGRARYNRMLSQLGRIARPYQDIIDAIVRSEEAAGRRSPREEVYIKKVEQEHPELPFNTCRAIAFICRHVLNRNALSPERKLRGCKSVCRAPVGLTQSLDFSSGRLVRHGILAYTNQKHERNIRPRVCRVRLPGCGVLGLVERKCSKPRLKVFPGIEKPVCE